MSGALFIVLVFAAMWAVVILPQQRQLKRHKALVADLAVGDDVVTTSGIHGAIRALDDEVVRLAVAPGVELRVDRRAIGRRVEPAATEAAGTDTGATGAGTLATPTHPLEA